MRYYIVPLAYYLVLLRFILFRLVFPLKPGQAYLANVEHSKTAESND